MQKGVLSPFLHSKTFSSINFWLSIDFLLNYNLSTFYHTESIPQTSYNLLSLQRNIRINHHQSMNRSSLLETWNSCWDLKCPLVWGLRAVGIFLTNRYFLLETTCTVWHRRLHPSSFPVPRSIYGVKYSRESQNGEVLVFAIWQNWSRWASGNRYQRSIDFWASDPE